MPEEEAKHATPEVRPDVQDAVLEQEQAVEDREGVEKGREEPEQGEASSPDRDETPEPVQLKVPAAPAAPSTAPVEKDPILKDIENLLADDLTDLFLALPDDKKWEFKQKGEETANKINEMIHGGKLKIKKIFDLIRDWLKMVPGVNKYFLEQEAKIKADKVMQYAEEQINASQNQV